MITVFFAVFGAALFSIVRMIDVCSLAMLTVTFVFFGVIEKVEVTRQRMRAIPDRILIDIVSPWLLVVIS